MLQRSFQSIPTFADDIRHQVGITVARLFVLGHVQSERDREGTIDHKGSLSFNEDFDIHSFMHMDIQLVMGSINNCYQLCVLTRCSAPSVTRLSPTLQKQCDLPFVRSCSNNCCIRKGSISIELNLEKALDDFHEFEQKLIKGVVVPR